MGIKNYTIKQGETWRRVLRWEQGIFVYKTITAITQAAPIQITADAHGLLDGWRFAVSNVLGMVEINASKEPPDENKDYHIASEVATNTVKINNINAVAYSLYKSGGILRYHPPVDLSIYKARMQFRKSAKDPTVLHELTTENSGIALNNTDKTITLLVARAATEAFSFLNCVYDLEMYTYPTDEVATPVEVVIPMWGSIAIDKNVTRLL